MKAMKWYLVALATLTIPSVGFIGSANNLYGPDNVVSASDFSFVASSARLSLLKILFTDEEGDVLIQGTAFVVDGKVVTARHVVEDGLGNLDLEGLTVEDSKGKKYEIKKVILFDKADLAILELDSKVNLPSLKISPILPRVGSWAVAIGHPIGLEYYTTLGIVAGFYKEDDSHPESNLIGFTSPINPGNSGGVLLDAQGRIIGVPILAYRGTQGIFFGVNCLELKEFLAR